MLELRELLQKERGELKLLEGINERVGHRIGELRRRIQAMEALEATSNPIPSDLFTLLEKYLPQHPATNGHKVPKPVPTHADDPQTYLVLAALYNVGNPGLTSVEVIDSVQRVAPSVERGAIHKALFRQTGTRLDKKEDKYYLSEVGISFLKALATEKTGEIY